MCYMEEEHYAPAGGDSAPVSRESVVALVLDTTFLKHNSQVLPRDRGGLIKNALH